MYSIVVSVNWNLPGPHYQATLGLLRAAEALWEGSRVFFERWKLSPSQFNILNLLVGEPNGMSQAELSRQLIMHRSNVTGLVDRMEKRKLLQRKETPGDRRAYRVTLTERGRRLLNEILPHYHQAAEEIWGGISVGQANQIEATFDKLSKTVAQIAQRGTQEDVI